MSSCPRLADRSQGRDNNFDVLRFGLAAIVILSHSYPLLGGDNDAEPLMRLTGGQQTLGECAVQGFFILSGFLIAQSWQRSRGLFDYLRRRVLRIYPGFVMAVLVTVLIVGPLAAANLTVFLAWFDPVRMILKIINLRGYEAAQPWMLPANPIHYLNGSLWSIRYEFLCYLGIAALGLSGLLSRRRFVFCLFVVSMACYALVDHGAVYTQNWQGQRYLGAYSLWARMAPQFLAGTVFYLYRDRVPCSLALGIASLAGLVIAGFVGEFAMLYPILGGYALLYAAFTPLVQFSDFARRGDLSYGLYLYAFPIQQLLIQRLPGLTPITLFLLASPLTIVAAMLSWKFVESPFMRIKKRKAATSPSPPLSQNGPVIDGKSAGRASAKAPINYLAARQEIDESDAPQEPFVTLSPELIPPGRSSLDHRA